MQSDPKPLLSNSDISFHNAAAESGAGAPIQAQLAGQLDAAHAEVSQLTAQLAAAQSELATAVARSEHLESELATAASEQVSVGSVRLLVIVCLG